MQRTKPVARRKAVPHMIAEQEFERGPPRLVDFSGFALNNHARRGLRSAGRNQSPLPSDQQLYEANLTRIQRTTLFQMTQCRNVDAEFSRTRKHGLSRFQLHFFSINGDFEMIHIN